VKLSVKRGATLVAGVDSSTQSVKVVVRELESGTLVNESKFAHPDGTECDPNEWVLALNKAISHLPEFDQVSAISIGGQQHGAVVLDETGSPVRKALLWNDTRSAKEALDLNQEFGGAQATADAVGSYLVASFTATKLRWIADHEPDSAKKIAAVCLPHDYLSWKLGQSNQISNLFTDRSDASGTGYFDSKANEYRNDFLKIALRGQFAQLPKVLKPNEVGGEFKGIQIAPGAGDNAGAALGVGAEPGDVVVSLGTSGTAFAVSETSTHDPSGQVAGFADATGKFLPLVCTLNAARILDAACNLLKVSHAELSDLALSAPAGANGLTLLPYFEGERTPNRPNARGTLNGLSNKNSDPASIARSYIEGMICGLADAVDALSNLGVAVNRIFLVGGAAKNPAVARIAASIFGRTVLIPPPGEYVANGAARQAAWTFSGELPNWEIGKIEQIDSVATPEVFTRYKDLVIKTENF
jgi:xylulokinase